MKMHALSGGRLEMKKRVFYPDADGDVKTELPVSCFLLRHAQGNVLFDTGCHPAVETDAEARWGGLIKYMTPVHRPGENVVDETQAAGARADDIDLVINPTSIAITAAATNSLRTRVSSFTPMSLRWSGTPRARAKAILGPMGPSDAGRCH